MKKALFTFYASLFFFGQLSAQEYIFSGYLIDSINQSPVTDAHIMGSENRGSITDQNGYFKLGVKKFPFELRVTHIHYGTHVFKFNQQPQGKVFLRIQPQTEQIGEVNITGQRIQIINRTNEYNISDFAFDEDQLWLLGNYLNKRNEPRLWLATMMGDTICSIPVTSECHLENDIFHNVHLFSGDTVIQLSTVNNDIYIVDKLPLSEYNRILRPIKASFDDKLVYSKYLPGQEGLHFYYQEGGNPRGHFLTRIRDTLEEIMQEYEYVYGHAGSVITSLMNTSGGKRLKIRAAMIARMQNKHNVTNHKIYAPLAGSASFLVITNVYQDSLLIYDENGLFNKTIGHKLSSKYGIFGIDYAHLSYLSDYRSQDVYMLEGEWAQRQLYLLNIQSGKLERIQIPAEISHQDIVIYDQAFYLLKPEKNYPYYNRLYRINMNPN